MRENDEQIFHKSVLVGSPQEGLEPHARTYCVWQSGRGEVCSVHEELRDTSFLLQFVHEHPR